MKEKGQALVEFAIILPMLMFLTLSIIYMGAMFMDYIQYNNAARDAARYISLRQAVDTRGTIMANINAENSTEWKKYATPITGLYTPTMKVAFVDSAGNDKNVPEANAVDVQVTITLDRTVKFSEDFERFMILPDKFPIVYKMKLEK